MSIDINGVRTLSTRAHTYSKHASHALIHTNAIILCKFIQSQSHNYIRTLYTIQLLHIHAFIILIGTFTLCNQIHTVTYRLNIQLKISIYLYLLTHGRHLIKGTIKKIVL